MFAFVPAPLSRGVFIIHGDRAPWLQHRSGFLALNIFVDLLLEDFERQRAVLEQRLVKFTLVEFFSELLFRAGAQFLNLEHSYFVGARLSRKDDVALDLRFHFLLAKTGLVAHV